MPLPPKPGKCERVKGWIDLHCHWIAGIDDGATTPEMGVEMLQRLYRLGFSEVVATPHMRPGLFDNTKASLERAYQAMLPHLGGGNLPQVTLSSEHYFDDQVFGRVVAGEGLPYPGERAVLLEFYDNDFPFHLDRLLSQLVRSGMTPVIAHPERYRPIWKDTERLEQLLDVGAVALLDVAAITGKYGDRPRRCALHLLEQGLYYAACSDAHRPDDVEAAAHAMDLVAELYGPEELEDLFDKGPREILSGNVQHGMA